MSTTNPNAESNYYLVDGSKVRHRTFGKKPASALFAVPTELANPQRRPFALRWEDQAEGLSVVIAENDVGRMIANVAVTGNTKPIAISIGLVGTNEYEWASKTIPLTRTNDADGQGSADFGSLADLAKRFGDRWCVVVFPVL